MDGLSEVREKLEQVQEWLTELELVSSGLPYAVSASLVKISEALALLKSEQGEQKHDCDYWAAEGIGCARCNPAALAIDKRWEQMRRDHEAMEKLRADLRIAVNDGRQQKVNCFGYDPPADDGPTLLIDWISPNNQTEWRYSTDPTDAILGTESEGT